MQWTPWLNEPNQETAVQSEKVPLTHADGHQDSKRADVPILTQAKKTGTRSEEDNWKRGESLPQVRRTRKIRGDSKTHRRKEETRTSGWREAQGRYACLTYRVGEGSYLLRVTTINGK